MMAPDPGTIWGGGGMTVRVLEVLGNVDDDSADVRVERLTGRGTLLKRPSSPAVIELAIFAGRMQPLDLTKSDPWTRAIRDRFVREAGS